MFEASDPDVNIGGMPPPPCLLGGRLSCLRRGTLTQ